MDAEILTTVREMQIRFAKNFHAGVENSDN